jgi:hypothetical protein
LHLAPAIVMRAWIALVALVALVASVLSSACGSADDHPPGAGGGSLPPGGVPQCDNDTGCPCLNPGQTIECKVIRRSGDYVACSVGERVCGDDGKWGECVGGDQIAK